MSKRIEDDSVLLSVLGYGASAPKEEEPTPTETPAETPKPKKPAKKKAVGSKAKTPAKEENRTRRVQLVLPPTLYDQLNEAAWSDRQSVNETIIQAITAYLKRR